MIIFPAIDIKGGKAVRLLKGKEDQEKVYFESPVDVALQFEKDGAEYIHVVDLDGAFRGKSENRELIGKIIEAVSIPVQVGGGIRSLEDAKGVMSLGAARFIVGTIAVENRELLREMISEFPGKVVVSLDCYGGKVATRGWTEESDLDALDVARELSYEGIECLVYTDISKDGTLMGPNLEELERISLAGTDVIASGGIGSYEDVRNVKKLGLYGTIVGKALYEKKVELKRLLEV